MHELFVAGKRLSVEVKELRDLIDEPYAELTEAQTERIEGLSVDLFDVEKITSEPAYQVKPETDPRIIAAVDALHSEQFDKALQILRECKDCPPFGRISYYRARIWELLGEPEIAWVFYEHAGQLNPSNEEYKAAALGAFVVVHPEKGMNTVSAIIEKPSDFPVLVVIKACEVKFDAALRALESDNVASDYQDIVDGLHNALERLPKPPNPRKISDAQPVYSLVCCMLATCCRNLGLYDPAFHYYTIAIGLDPLNHTLLTSRGALAYGRSLFEDEFAFADFDRAVRCGSDMAVPFYYMGHYLLRRGLFEYAIRCFDEGLKGKGGVRLKSEMVELKAIALAGFGAGESEIVENFQWAERIDATNQRIAQNLAVYQQWKGTTDKPLNAPWKLDLDATRLAREMPTPKSLRDKPRAPGYMPG
jgi:tetratricopeptide (TPR) repeat protein